MRAVFLESFVWACELLGSMGTIEMLALLNCALLASAAAVAFLLPVITAVAFAANSFA